MNNYERLFELIRKEEVVLFVGAGFSIKAGYPSGNELCQLIYKELNDSERQDIRDNLPLADLTEEFVQIRHSSRNHLITLLKTVFGKSPTDLSDQNKIKSIPHFKDIITTNYDTSFESVYSDSHNLIFKDSDCTYIDKLKTSIFKIHGDLSVQDSIVITKSDYRHYFDKENNIIFWTKIKDLLASNSVLFIGYGIDDDNILSIIESINSALGSNRKEMFLVAPEWKAHKIQTLNSYKIKYFDDTADVFLSQLIENIKSHIKDDFDNKRISSETFSQFCEYFSILPIVSHSKNKNDVIRVESTNNQPIESKLKFSVTEDIAQKINKGEFEENGLPIKIKGNDISAYPTITIPVEKIHNFEYRINDIVFSNNNNIEKLHVVKLPNLKGELIVKTPDNDKFTNINFELFLNHINNRTEGKIIAKTLLYKITLNFIRDNRSGNTQVSWNTDFNDTFRNTITAIHWTELLIKLYIGGLFSFYLNSYNYNFEIPVIEEKDKVLADLERHLDYYNILSEIEKIRKHNFTSYNKFTEQNYEYSKIVLCYLKKEFELIPAKNFKSSFVFLGDDNFTKMIDDKPDARYVFLQTALFDSPLILNGVKFMIPYKNIIYTECMILNVLIKEDGNYVVEFENLSDNIQVSYSDKGIRQEGLEIKFF